VVWSAADEDGFEEAEMSSLGTDVLALACIAGGAAVSGTATMAWLDEGRAPAEMTMCVVEAKVAAAPAVIVTAGGERGRTVVVSSSAKRVRAVEACGRADRVRREMLVRELARARSDVERAGAEVARARAEAERARAGVDQMRRDVERVRAEIERRKR
jgi:hypothetical protein